MSEETSRIEAEIDQSRHRLNDTLNAMGGKLSPGQLVDEMLGLAQGQASQFTQNLGRQIRDNPLPVVLIAAGLAALLVSQRRTAQRTDTFYDDEIAARATRMDDETQDDWEERLHVTRARSMGMQQGVGETVDAFKARVRDAARKVGQGARAVTGAVTGAAHFARAQAGHMGDGASAVTRGAQDFFTENPLAAGAVAMAVGVVLGSAAPLSRTERRALSGVADSAADLAARSADAIAAKAEALH